MYVEAKANTASLGQSLSEWWTGRASIDVNGQGIGTRVRGNVSRC